MSDIGKAMLEELRRIREALEGSQPLGFGKRAGPVYLFIKFHQQGGQTYLWYKRDRHEGQNVPVPEHDLTGYLTNLWRFDRVDDATGERVPRLNVQVRADKDYVIQTGFYTNFSKSLLAGLLELEAGALKEPVTLVLEDNLGSKARPTVFCRVEWRGVRMSPSLGKEREHKDLYRQVVERFGFNDPYAAGGNDV